MWVQGLDFGLVKGLGSRIGFGLGFRFGFGFWCRGRVRGWVWVQGLGYPSP